MKRRRDQSTKILGPLFSKRVKNHQGFERIKKKKKETRNFLIMEESLKKNVDSAREKVESAVTSAVINHLTDSIQETNPFSAAFENSSDESFVINPSPYQLGSIYGEDSLSLLENEYTTSDPGPSNSKNQSSPKAQGGPLYRGEPDIVIGKTEAQAKQGLLSYLCGAILCVSEHRVFQKLGVAGKSNLKGTDLWLAKQAFIIHWIDITALVLNVVVFSSFILGSAPEAGLNRDQIASFGSWAWSLCFLILGSYGSWYVWLKPLAEGLEPDAKFTPLSSFLNIARNKHSSQSPGVVFCFIISIDFAHQKIKNSRLTYEPTFVYTSLVKEI